MANILQTTSPRAEPVRCRLRVLVVEDHKDCADSMTLLLELNGHEAQIARHGMEALSMAEEWRPDVVLLDISLPGHLDGWGVAQRLKRMDTGRPPLLIAVTGYGQEADRVSSREAGIDLHLVKPANLDVLEGVLQRFRELLFGWPEAGKR